MPTVFLAGASRGLGLEFARQYAADGWRVIATARDPRKADALGGVRAEVHALDEAGAHYEIEVYEGARHGFAVTGHPAYDAAAAERHWEALLRLFGETLAPTR